MPIKSAKLGQGGPKQEAMDSPGEILTDLGIALAAFGTALQLAGTRMQTLQKQPAIAPQAPSPLQSAPTLPLSGMPMEGYVRVWDIIGRKPANGEHATRGMIPMSRATWYSGVASGRFPKPIKHGRIAMWRVEDIRTLVAQLVN